MIDEAAAIAIARATAKEEGWAFVEPSKRYCGGHGHGLAAEAGGKFELTPAASARSPASSSTPRTAG